MAGTSGRRLAVPILAVVAVVGTGAGYVLLTGNGPGEPTVGGPEPRPEDTSALVAGTATALELDPTLLDPIGAPTTIEAVERGRASATISGVVVDGQTQAIAWSGSGPITIEGSGSVVLEPVRVTLDGGGITAHLDGVAASMRPGLYAVDGDVAVGPSGVGRAASRVSFEATEATRVHFRGESVLRLPPATVTLEGPGAVRLVGDVDVTTAAEDRRVGGLEFGPGPYRVTIVWVGGLMEIDAVLRGRVEPTSR